MIEIPIILLLSLIASIAFLIVLVVNLNIRLKEVKRQKEVWQFCAKNGLEKFAFDLILKIEK